MKKIWLFSFCSLLCGIKNTKTYVVSCFQTCQAKCSASLKRPRKLMWGWRHQNGITAPLLSVTGTAECAYLSVHPPLDLQKVAEIYCYICRSLTDLQRDHSLFSLATPNYHNALLTFWENKNKNMHVYINNKVVQYQGLDYKLNKWHSVCATWNSTTRVVQMWFDGQPLTWKNIDAGSSIRLSPVIVLGQVWCNHLYADIVIIYFAYLVELFQS